MNPNRGENITFEPLTEQSLGNESVDELKNESGVTTQENAPAKQTSAPALPVAPTDIPTVANPVIPNDDATQDDATDTGSGRSANPDRIEKQWIDKAKAIVNQSKDDPYKQKTEMSKIKAEYIKTRFNKAIKTE